MYRTFWLLDHTLPLNLVDLVDEIWIIACAITNMQPPLVGPRPTPEGSNKIVSVRPSFHLSISFLRIGSLVFSETQYAVRGPYIIICDYQIFWKKSPSGKNDTKWSKMTPKQDFWSFYENHISFVQNLCKTKVLMVH